MQDTFNENPTDEGPSEQSLHFKLECLARKRSILRSLQMACYNWQIGIFVRLETVHMLTTFGACSLKSDKTFDDG